MGVEGRPMRMLMQTMSPKGFVSVFFVFLVALLICIIIGATGPAAYDTIETSAWGCSSGANYYDAITCNGTDLTQNGSYWIGQIQNLDKLNQELLLQAYFLNRNISQGVQDTVYVSVVMEGHNSNVEPWNVISTETNTKTTFKCVQGKSKCNSFIISYELFLHYSSYRFNVTMDFADSPSFIGDIIFEYSYVDHNYTLFELWFRFAFLLITFVVLIAYSHRLKSYSLNEWTFEQKWGAILLFGLLAYDNPFYPLEILASGWFPIFINRLLYASFIVLILFFWLVLFDGIRKEASSRSFKSFYLSKVILLGSFWVVGIIVYTWSQLQQSKSPFYQSSNLPGYVFFQVVLLAMLIMYTFWLIYATCRTVGDLKTLPHLGIRIKFFGVFTLLIIITNVAALIFGAGTSVNSAAEFLSFFSLFNLYVYVLAFIYLPSQTAQQTPPNSTEIENKTDRLGMVRLDEDTSSIDLSVQEEH